jgi:hypothetical protein
MSENIEEKKPRDDNTLFYLLWFLLFACLVALGGIWYYNWSASQRFAKEAFEPTQEDLRRIKADFKGTSDLVRLQKRNQRIKNSCQRKLDKNYNPNLTSQKKAQLQARLNQLGPSLSPIEFAARLQRIRGLMLTPELQQEQVKKQQNFLKNTFPQIEEEAKEKLDEIIKFFFEYSFQTLSQRDSSKITWKGFTIEKFRGKEKGPFSEEDYETCKAILAPKYAGFPPQPLFKGFDRFLTEEDEEEREQKEGKITLGLTSSGPDDESPDYLKPCWDGEVIRTAIMTFNVGKKKFPRVIPYKFSPNSPNPIYVLTTNRFIDIRLKKEFLFNRGEEEWDEWIEVNPEKNTFLSTDISWENVLETIAHELAHAVINKMMENYDQWQRATGIPGDGKGHGELHTAYTQEIEALIKDHPKGKEFEKWWKKG